MNEEDGKEEHRSRASERWWRNGETINISSNSCVRLSRHCCCYVADDDDDQNARARIDDVNDDGKAIFGLAQFRSLINFTVVVALFHRTLSSTVLIVICLLLPLLSSFFRRRRRSLNYPRARRTTTKKGRLDYIYWSFQLKEEWVELARLWLECLVISFQSFSSLSLFCDSTRCVLGWKSL